MHSEEVAPGVHVFSGHCEESVATAFVADGQALLVDTLASERDAHNLHSELCGRMGVKVKVVLLTHYMSDHLAGVHMYRDAEVIAHEHYLHTYFSQADRDAYVEQRFVHPTRLIRNRANLRWGGRLLRVFHNPGHTVSTLNVDVPELDLLITSDTLVGHTTYLSSTAPSMLDAALARIDALGRRHLVPGHIGVMPGSAARNARTYLRRLAQQVQSCREPSGAIDRQRLRQVDLESCRVSDTPSTAFERTWHGHNLEVIHARNLFPRGPAGDIAPDHGPG